MDKSPDAFRTISEVADHLDTPAHVLRFWESRFPQIKPVKRAGGRRYYRPADVALLAGIKRLLHDEGMTIRGVQKVLREQGIRHVAGLVADADHVAEVFAVDAALLDGLAARGGEGADVLPETAEILPFDAALRDRDAAAAGLGAAEGPAADAAVQAADDSLSEPIPEAPFVAVEDEGPPPRDNRWDVLTAHIEQARGRAPQPTSDVAAPPDLWTAADLRPTDAAAEVTPDQLPPPASEAADAATRPAEPDAAPAPEPVTDGLVEVDLRPIPPLAARLRRLPTGTELPRGADIAALRARLSILREAMAEAGRGRSR